MDYFFSMEMIELGPLMELSKAKEMVGMIIMPTCKYQPWREEEIGDEKGSLKAKV